MNPSKVFRKRNLININFDYEDLIGRNLSDSNMSGVDLKNRDIHNADLSCTDLSGANLSGSILFYVKFSPPRKKTAKIKQEPPSQFFESPHLSCSIVSCVP